MVRTLFFLIISSLLTFSLYPVFINFLYRFRIQETVNPDVPRTHFGKRGTPTAAGLLPILLFILLNIFFNRSPEVVILLLVVGGLGLLGVLEDFFKIYHRSKLRRTVRSAIVPVVTFSDLSWNLYKIALFPWNAFREVFRALGSQQAGGILTYQKILFQTVVAALMALWITATSGSGFWIPFLGTINWGGAFYPVLIVLLFLFFVNSISVTDGLDGLVGGLLAVGFSALMLIALAMGKVDLAVAAGILVGGLLPFLYFNIFPARVFAGNVGALAWAAAFVSLTLLLDRAVLLPVIGGVFVVEGLSVLLQVGAVKLGKERIFLMAPIHHHFEMKGWAETKVTMRFWLAAAFLAFLGIFLALL
ncbi:MAG: phospho-N-acetylmuramoyl-pentapeptide-transferase [Patescibacteria group bacterium]|nr:MAG: phospho-N-acetylmuramoyl-pentapeptide-transferase [Patescibacteria group bacterium]